MSALRQNDVRVALGRLHELEVHRLDGVQVLIDYRVHRPAALGDVALQPANEPRVGVGVDEHLDVHQFAQRRVGEDEDAFDDDGPARMDGFGDRLARVQREVVDGRLDGPPPAQVLDVPHHEVGFEGVGMVVVERGTFLEAQVVAIPVVAVVFEHGHVAVAEAADDALHDRGLA